MKRRPLPTFAAARRTRREQKASAYSLFWHYIEPQRQADRNRKGLELARDHDDKRRARKGLKPRDAFWQKRLGLGS